MATSSPETKTYDLTFSDSELGHPELGFIPRRDDPDDEDRAFRRHLKRRGLDVVSVHDGRATVRA